MSQSPELVETLSLVRHLRRHQQNYARLAEIPPAALRRTNEALIDCARQAIEDLHGGNKGDRIRAMEAWICSLENEPNGVAFSTR